MASPGGDGSDGELPVIGLAVGGIALLGGGMVVAGTALRMIRRRGPESPDEATRP